jgi:cellulose synthase/poly-beta-1,6-N-acetylglucosamine synthase-like glycosyltransferase
MNAVDIAWGVVLLPGALYGYAYLCYPALLWLAGRIRPRNLPVTDPAEWPQITVVVPAYNEEASIRRTIESLLSIDYPTDRRHILVISDASTDRTDEIVREYAARGVQLLRQEQRGGKDAGEISALPHLKGDIVVNTDATIRILPDALKPLIRAFQDPTVGLASGRDVSLGSVDIEANRGESGYVGYEMWVRSLETRTHSIVGASGCFYAIRRALHGSQIPPGYSRDFASALVVREHGYRAVSVDQAVCLVPRTASLQREFRRKVRTMTRGLRTLWLKRGLLNPLRYGRFAWMLWSHKLVRWMVFPAVLVALAALLPLSLHSSVARLLLATAGVGILLGTVAMRAPEGQPLPRLVALCGFVLASHVAGVLAWVKALRGESNSIWEPTRRTA